MNTSQYSRLILLLAGWLWTTGAALAQAPQVNITFQSPSCAGYTNGTATAEVTGGTAPYTFNWSNGQHGQTNYGIAAGQVSVTVTDANGQQGSANILVTEPAALTAFISFGTQGPCQGVGTGLVGHGVGGTPPYTYRWEGGTTGPQLTAASEGLYVVTVTDANGCEAVAVLPVKAQLQVEVRAVDVTCADYCDGSVEAVVVGGVPPLRFQWSNGATDQVVFPLPPGDYTVTVTDANGCQSVSTGSILAPPTISTEVNVTNACTGVGLASANVVATGGVPPYTFEWSNGPRGESVSSLNPGNYSVTVTDANGCKDIASFRIENTPALVVSIDANQPSCNSTEGGSLKANATGGTAPYTFEWSNGSAADNITGLGQGMYFVTVTDAAGCQGMASAPIRNTGDLVLEMSAVDAQCAGVNTGMGNALPLGGVAPYSFRWSNGQVTGTAVELAPGNYTVTVVDAANCQGTGTVTVNARTTLEMNFQVTQPSCQSPGGISVDVSGGTAPYEYNWSNDATTANISGINPGQYSVTVTDAKNCPISNSFNLSTPDQVTASFESKIGACSTDEVTIDFKNTSQGNPTTLHWFVNGVDAGTGNNISYTGADGATLDVLLVATNAAGCRDSLAKPVELVGLDIKGPADQFACLNDAVPLAVEVSSGDNNLTYSWAPADAFSAGTDSANPTYNSAIPGKRKVYVTVSNGAGCTQTDSLEVGIFDKITADPNAIKSQQCTGYTVDFINSNTTNGLYTWYFGDPADPTAASSDNNPTHNYSEPGTYEVLLVPVADVPCADTIRKTVTVTEPAEVDFSAGFNDCQPKADVLFNNQSTAPGGITGYSWNFGNGQTATDAAPTVEFTESADLNVTLTITYGENCSLSNTEPVEVKVHVFDPPKPTDKQVCEGKPIDLLPGASDDLVYTWSPAEGLSDANSPNPSAMPNQDTEYKVTIETADGVCKTEESLKVIVGAPIELSTTQDTALCTATELTLNAESSRSDVTFTWYKDAALTDSIGNAADLVIMPDPVQQYYYVLVKGAEGCESVDSIMVENNAIAVLLTTDTAVCKNKPIQITSRNLRPEQQLEFQWTPNSTDVIDDPTSANPVVNPAESTMFMVEIKNEFGCNKMDSIDVTVIDLAKEVNLTADPDTILQGQTSQLQATQDGKYTYSWSPSSTLSNGTVFNPVASPEETTMYQVTVSDDNGCVETREVEIVVVVGECEEPYLYFPNAFSPNGDGSNDRLRLRAFNATDVHFVIYNRWGEKVFEAFSQEDEWDGTHRGEPVCSDVYGYYLEVVCRDGESFFKKGNVTVLK